MQAVEKLKEEHRLNEKMLDHLEKAMKPLSRNKIVRCLQFFWEWTDEVHHPKEEVLFSELLSRARELALGPVQVMRKEHAITRAYLQRALRVLEGPMHPRSEELLRRYVEAFAKLQRKHMAAEETVLFSLCEQLIPPSVDGDLLSAYAKAAQGRLPAEVVARYERFATSKDETMVVRDRRAAEPSWLDAKTLSSEQPRAHDETYLSAKAGAVLHRAKDHRVLRLHDFGSGLAVQANQYLITDHGEGMILDPGGPKIYPNVFAETMMALDGGRLRYVFLSHQDPDICTSLNAWLMDTEAEALTSKLWMRFLPHFGIDRLLEERLRPIPDKGMCVTLGRRELMLLPAHFLHSAGNFHVYDPESKVLFSGDLGASISGEGLVVEDFDKHVPGMLGFHRRYMASTQALARWADLVEPLDIETIAPQHGPLLRGKQIVRRFKDWCRTLPCGVEAMEPFSLPRLGER